MTTSNILLVKYNDNVIKYYINDSNIQLENIINDTKAPLHKPIFTFKSLISFTDDLYLFKVNNSCV